MDRVHVALKLSEHTPNVTGNGYSITWGFNGLIAPDAQMTFGYVVIEPGHSNPVHVHPTSEEVLYLISGELEHSFNAEVVRMGPGDAIRVPAGVVHDARTIGSVPAVMIVCYSSANRDMELATRPT
jgi:quercetin dioxygenase-like cupin family protein